MKIIQYTVKGLLFILFIGTVFTSCSKSESVPDNQPPNSFNLISVADGATDIGLEPQLKWEAATDPDGDQVTYQVYLDAQNPPQTSIVNNLDVNTFTVDEALHPKTTYYWKVVAKDKNGKTTESDISSFTTRDMTNAEAIIGKWFYESISGQPPLSACNKRSFLHFTEELSLRNEIFSQGSSKICGREFSSEYNYEVNGDQLRLSNKGVDETYLIESITDTELVLLIRGESYTFRKE